MDAFLLLMIRVVTYSFPASAGMHPARPDRSGGGPFGLPVTMEDMTWQNWKIA